MRRPLTGVALALGLLGAFLAAPASAGQPRQSPPAAPGVDIPADVTAGVAVFDRSTGSFTERINADHRFRSASIVKLLLTLDFLWDRGPGYDIPQQDRGRLEAMLRSSDDDEASYYWAQRGRGAIIERMVPRLGLTGTTPPPAAYPGYWGYTSLTAADTVRIYRHILDEAPAPVRDFIMGNLHRATRCANDGYDQYFGIPSAFEGPWAVKQGWSGFSSGGCTADDGTPAAADAVAGAGARGPAGADRPPAAGEAGAPALPAASPARSAADVDLVREALHTTGTVGADDRTIVAVLTLHPDGTPYGTAYSGLTRLVGSLDVPGARRPAGTWFETWGDGVRIRAGATTSSAVVSTLPAGADVLVSCQRRGQLISDPPHSSAWWAHLPQYGGYMTTVYIDAESRLPGVPDCT
ncbi:SH3 domain-containing protein [Streptomyces sp. F63]|nr:SH3 domain-containing protein [Streptomyces sp. F63]